MRIRQTGMPAAPETATETGQATAMETVEVQAPEMVRATAMGRVYLKYNEAMKRRRPVGGAVSSLSCYVLIFTVAISQHFLSLGYTNLAAINIAPIRLIDSLLNRDMVGNFFVGKFLKHSKQNILALKIQA